MMNIDQLMKRKKLTFGEIKALGLHKGDRVEFSGFGGSEKPTHIGTIKSIRAKRGKAAKYFCGARNRWVDGEWIQYYEISFEKVSEIRADGSQSEPSRWGVLEDTFYILRKVSEVKRERRAYDGQTAEELMFNWTRDELREFAKELGISGRGSMNKAQLALAIAEHEG